MDRAVNLVLFFIRQNHNEGLVVPLELNTWYVRQQS